jgi:hypothetical protein
MVRQAITRLFAAAGVTAVAVALSIGPGGPALAAPKSSAPTAVQLVGTDLPDGAVTVQKADQPRLFQSLYDEVSWLASAKPQTTAPAAKNLGPKYTISVLVKNAPTQAYDLYPTAVGGPRAHRMAKQPGNKKVTDGWFYGRLTMSEALRAAGAPLKPRPDTINGGIGGGMGSDISPSSDDIDPVAGMNTFLNQIRQLFLLNGAVLVVVLFGLAGVAFLIRRRV